MIDLYSYSQMQKIFFLLATILLLIGTGAFAWLTVPLRRFQGWSRRFLELSSLSLLFLLCLILGDQLSLHVNGLVITNIFTDLRYILAICSLLQAVNLWQGQVGAHWIGAMALGMLPLADIIFPLNLLLVFFAAAMRLFIGFPLIMKDYEDQLTERSLEEAINKLPAGIIYAHIDGTIVLINAYMLAFMDKLAKEQYRNAHSFWNKMLSLTSNVAVQKEYYGNDMLFKFADGSCYLLTRQVINLGREQGLQLTLADVRELEALNQELLEKKQVLEARNASITYLLKNIEYTKTKETLEELMVKVHDLLGLRLSLLQQALRSKSLENIPSLLASITGLVPAIRQDYLADAHKVLAKLIETYNTVGVKVELNGSLPQDQELAKVLVEIIREALNNAVRHGKANLVTISFAYSKVGALTMTIRDNGLGCSTIDKKGLGLKTMEKKLAALGGYLTWRNQEGFTLVAKVWL